MRGFLAEEVPTNDEVNTVLYRRAVRTVDEDVIDETQPITQQVTRTTATRTRSTFRCPYVRFPRWCFWIWLLLLLALLATVLGVGIGLGTRKKTVTCSTGYFYDSSLGLCVLQVGIGHGCSASNQCFTNALCTNGVCKCITGYYPSPTTGQCNVDKTYGQSCTYDLECAFTFECLSGVCTCNSTKYYSTLTLRCEKLGEPNQDTCYANYNCISTAVCIGGVCRCPTNWYYNVFTDTCDRALLVGQQCTASYQCMTNANCTLVAAVNRCQCISGTTYSVIYGGCITPIAYNKSCLATADCASNFVCTSVNGASYCLCGSSVQYYYSFNTTCLDKVLFNQPCSALGPYCDDGQLLQCSASGNCTCPTGYYYSATTSRCEAQIYPGNTCTTTASCISNAVCFVGTCQCINGSYYYDVTSGQCVALKSYGTACSEEQQCQTNLYCISNICQCYSTQYYNVTSISCTTDSTLGSSCNSATGLYCNTAVGLYCSGGSVCSCPTNYYWNGTTCLQKSNLYAACTANASCPTNAACTAGTCQCGSAIFYYNAITDSCVLYSTYAQTCVANVFVTDECSSGSNLACSSTTSGVCQCTSGFYYNGTACVAQSTNGVACASSTSCNSVLGLVCSAGLCSCASGTYWSGTACVATLGAGQSCVAGACTSPLTCQATKCACPAGSYLDWITVQCLTNIATGSACSYSFQCTSGSCTNSIC